MLILYDLLKEDIRKILDKGLYCEDNELRIRNSVKYDLYNLVEMNDNEWLKKKLKELEYEEE